MKVHLNRLLTNKYEGCEWIFQYIFLYGRERLGKTCKENKNNYRKAENQSKHNDSPVCGKNKRLIRKTKGTTPPFIHIVAGMLLHKEGNGRAPLR